MSYSDGKAVYATREASAYPHLDALLGGYFHQDFDVFGNTLAEILATYAKDTSTSERQGTVSDIHRFLAEFDQFDDSLAVALQRIFEPGVIVEGWEGLTTRAWLLEIGRLLA